MAFMLLAFTLPGYVVAQNEQATSLPTTPKVEGSKYEEQDVPQPKTTKADLYMALTLSIMQVLLTPREKQPKQRTRGETVQAGNCNTPDFHGRCSIFQFTNSDFPTKGNSCAQAAMSTALWTVGVTYNNDQKALAKNVFSVAPPKITLGNMIQVQGSLGTDWRQFNSGMDGFGKTFGTKYAWIDGEAQIKKYLAMNYPVVIMLDTGTLKQFDYKWWTGHWVTAFAYDRDYIYVSNFPGGRMTWAELDAAFRKGTLAVGHGTAGRAAVVWK